MLFHGTSVRDSLRCLTLTYPGNAPVLIARVMPKENDPWGLFAPLRGTPWESLIATVPGEAMSHALRGFLRPLLAVLGPPPDALARLLPEANRPCFQRRTCPMVSPKCVPGPKLPDCYEADNLPPDALVPAAAVALAWRDGFRVVVVIGPEHT